MLEVNDYVENGVNQNIVFLYTIVLLHLVYIYASKTIV